MECSRHLSNSDSIQTQPVFDTGMSSHNKHIIDINACSFDAAWL